MAEHCELETLLAEYSKLKATIACMDVKPPKQPEICGEYLVRGRTCPGDPVEKLGKDSAFVRLGLANEGDEWNDATIDKVYPEVRFASMRHAEDVGQYQATLTKRESLNADLKMLVFQIADYLTSDDEEPCAT
jgi:hypothetical protein